MRPWCAGFRARFAHWMLRLAGWRVVLAQPVPLRCVVVFYPHTSNWDFPFGSMAKWLVGVHFRFIAKDSLFDTPLGPWLRRWGGIPVDRSGGTGVIARLAASFAEHDDFRLVVAPEGTRSRTERWKSGFYHLARAANVPLALSFIDYRRRETGVGGYVDLTGRHAKPTWPASPRSMRTRPASARKTPAPCGWATALERTRAGCARPLAGACHWRSWATAGERRLRLVAAAWRRCGLARR